MTTYPPKTPVENDGKKGFALLITITLLAFLVLLLVSLAALTRVETQVASNSQQIATSRQNAMMALNIAIGQLQQTAGPDQRVTARAEILDTGSTILRNTGSGAMRQPLWTGVWMTNNPASGANNQLDSGPSPLRAWSTASPTGNNSRVAWLVSGASTPTATTTVNNTTVNPSSWTATATNSVELARNVGPSTNVTVSAPLVNISSSAVPGLTGPQTIGRYAYWVSDEGVKAKVNLRADTINATSGSVIQQAHLTAAQANAIHKVSNFMASSSADFRTAVTTAEIDKILQPDALPLIAAVNQTSPIRVFAPDITTYGATVLADVRNGGLKKDLTAAFESADEFDRFLGYARNLTRGNAGDGPMRRDYAGDERVFRFPLQVNANHAPYADNTGLRWLSLYNYYNLYKNTYDLFPYNTSEVRLAKTAVNFPGIGSPSQNAIPMRVRSYSYSSGSGAGTFATGYADPIMPIVIGQSLYIGFSTEKTTKPTTPAGLPDPGAGQSYYKIRIHFLPQLTLWNPYNVRLTAPANLTFRYTSNILTGPNGNGPRWTITAGNSAPLTTIISDKSIVWTGTPGSNPRYSTAGLTIQTSPAANIEIEPGALKVFGIRTPIGPLSVANALNITGLVNDSVAGSGTWAYLPQDTSSSDWVGLLNDTDNLSVRWTAAGSFNTNDGRVRVMLGAVNWNGGNWPKTFAGTEYARTYNSSTNNITNLAQPRVLGTVDSLQSTVNRAIKTVAQINIRARGASTSDAFKIPVFDSFSDVSNPLSLDRDSATQEVRLGSTDSSPGSSPPENAISTNALGEATTFFGRSSTGADATDFQSLVLKEIPRLPLLSLGQFRHLEPYYSFPNSLFPVAAGLGFIRNSVLYSVGGSRAHAYIPTDSSAFYDPTPQSPGNLTPTMLIDDNYLSNEALFDRYFFSSIPGEYQNSNATNYYPFQQFNDAYIAAGGVLPLNRMIYYSTNGTPPTVSSLQRYDTAAAGLMLNGGFNINSTSFEAWKAFLASSSGTNLAGVTQGDTPFPRFSNAGAFSAGLWNGIAKLDSASNDIALNNLAQAIVTEVKRRGPFLSLADFLNRRLGPDSALTRTGALQAAIDNTITLNSGLAGAGGVAATSTVPTNNNHNRYVFQPNAVLDGKNAASPLQTTSGIPGHLNQGDIAQALAPAMSARSDTFVIRVYGASINPVIDPNTPVSTAYAEAVVQRVPEFVDSTDTPEKWTDLTNFDFFNPSNNYTITSINQNFGRRFKIISFRWLSSNDL